MTNMNREPKETKSIKFHALLKPSVRQKLESLCEAYNGKSMNEMVEHSINVAYKQEVGQ